MADERDRRMRDMVKDLPDDALPPHMEFRAHPAALIIFPNLISPGPLLRDHERPSDLEDLAALSVLCLIVPHGGAGATETPYATLRGSQPSWSHALTGHIDKGGALFLTRLRELCSSADSASSKQMYTAMKPKRDIVSINWVAKAATIDPALVMRVYASRVDNEMISFCWHCGAGGPTKQLFNCGRCKRACFCSEPCQRAAWWWHKVTDTPEWRCDDK